MYENVILFNLTAKTSTDFLFSFDVIHVNVFIIYVDVRKRCVHGYTVAVSTHQRL